MFSVLGYVAGILDYFIRANETVMLLRTCWVGLPTGDTVFIAPNGEGMIDPVANRLAMESIMPMEEWEEIQDAAGLFQS